MNQEELFNQDFQGKTYVRKFDHSRLKGQAINVFKLMSDNKWRTLNEIHNILNYPEASISATLRDFRKKHFGGHIVNRQRRGNPKQGLFEYQLIVNQNGEITKKPKSKPQKKAISLSMIKKLGHKLPEIYKEELRNIYKQVANI
jgi:predicted transcriptional regulator